MTPIRRADLLLYFPLVLSLFLLPNIVLFYSIPYGIAFAINNTATIVDVNHQPVAKSFTVPLKSNMPVSFILNASDPDKNDKITFVIEQEPDVGRIATLDPGTGEGVYAPLMNVSGKPLQGFFIFRANDSEGSLSNLAIVTFIPSEPARFTDGTGTEKVNITLSTDKNTYGAGDLVRVSGTVDNSVQGKTVRLDVYDPKGNVFQPINSSFSTGPREEWSDPYPLLSDIQVKPDDNGLFSYRFPLADPLSAPFIKGTYKIEVTYDDVTSDAMFSVQ